MNELNQMLAMMATKEQVIDALGLKEEQSDEFWLAQYYTVKNRFLSYLLYKHRLDMTLVSSHINSQDLYELAATAEEAMKRGVTYAFIRQWWQTTGTYLHNRAFEAKHEREKIQQMEIVVLVFFPKGRPMYLSYLTNSVVHVPNMVNNKEDAFGFPVMSITDLNRKSLESAAKDFDSAVKWVGGTHCKLLPRQKV